MEALSEKQILEWKEELSKQAAKLEQAKKVVKESEEAILFRGRSDDGNAPLSRKRLQCKWHLH